jgi:prepilin signal peptidase PulO-like enzyme (type II secretory pathway)
LFFFSIFALSKGRAMGFGDVKFGLFMGLFLGWPNIAVALFTAFMIGGFMGIILILLKKKGMKSEIPFGPFLITGTFIALFWGEVIIGWYLRLVLV